MKSVIRSGFNLTIFSYGKVEGPVPKNIEIADARSVIEKSMYDQISEVHGITAFSDLFRYEGIMQGFGVWTDTYVVFLHRGFISSNYIFGQEKETTYGTAILGFPPGCDFGAYLIDEAKQKLLADKKSNGVKLAPRFYLVQSTDLN